MKYPIHFTLIIVVVGGVGGDKANIRHAIYEEQLYLPNWISEHRKELDRRLIPPYGLPVWLGAVQKLSLYGARPSAWANIEVTPIFHWSLPGM